MKLNHVCKVCGRRAKAMPLRKGQQTCLKHFDKNLPSEKET